MPCGAGGHAGEHPKTPAAENATVNTSTRYCCPAEAAFSPWENVVAHVDIPHEITINMQIVLISTIKPAQV
jgi:hypothetical protein